MSQQWQNVPLASIMQQVERPEPVDPTCEYRMLGAKWYALGLYVRETLLGSAIAASRVYRVEPGDFVYNRLFAWKGSFAVAGAEHAECYVSNEFPCFTVDRDAALPEYLWWYFKQEPVWRRVLGLSEGATPTSRNRLKEERFLSLTVPLPPLAEQRRIVERLNLIAARLEEAHRFHTKSAAESSVLHSSVVASRLGSLACRTARVVEVLRRDETLSNGLSVKSAVGDAGVACLTLAAMRDGRVNLAEKKPVPITEEQARPVLVRTSDVFIVRGNGNKRLCGQAGIVSGSPERTIFPDLFIRVPIDPALILPQFFVTVWNAGPVRAAVEERAKTTSGIWKINQGHIESMVIPVPPLDEQSEFVEDMDAIQASVHRVRHLHVSTAQSLSALRVSALNSAFAGSL